MDPSTRLPGATKSVKIVPPEAWQGEGLMHDIAEAPGWEAFGPDPAEDFVPRRNFKPRRARGPVVDAREPWADKDGNSTTPGHAKGGRRKVGPVAYAERLSSALAVFMQAPNRWAAVTKIMERLGCCEAEAKAWYDGCVRFNATQAKINASRDLEEMREEYATRLLQAADDALEAKNPNHNARVQAIRHAADIRGLGARVVPGPSMTVANVSVQIASSAREHAELVEEARRLRLEKQAGVHGARGLVLPKPSEVDHGPADREALERTEAAFFTAVAEASEHHGVIDLRADAPMLDDREGEGRGGQ